MAAAPKPKAQFDQQPGINAILLGAPGSGKGTQVSITRPLKSIKTMLHNSRFKFN